jgi:hypothetical protein
MCIHSFTCTNTAAFNFTDPHGTCRCRFIFMKRGFNVVCILWTRAAEVPFNIHTAVMPVTLLLNFIVIAYQSPSAPIICSCRLFIFFPSAFCSSTLKFFTSLEVEGGGKCELIYLKGCNLLDNKNQLILWFIFLCTC